MPLSKEAQRAWQEKPPRREVQHDTVAPMTRFGRKWLWDLTLNVPVHLLAVSYTHLTLPTILPV